MKQSIPVPVVTGVVVAILVVIVGYFFWSTNNPPRTPRPDPAMFGGGKPTGPPNVSAPQAR